MDHNNSLDRSLDALGQSLQTGVPDGFMDGVWQCAGKLGLLAERRRNLTLLLGLCVVGLGAGIGTTQTSSADGSATFFIGASSRLAPSALLQFAQ